MATYTADAVALLVYLVDSLPQRADEVFAEVEAGETVIQAPSRAMAEVFYSVSRDRDVDRDVRGVQLTGSPEAARQALLANGPVSLAPVDERALAEYVTVVDAFSIHDALVVASHRARGTGAGSPRTPSSATPASTRSGSDGSSRTIARPSAFWRRTFRRRSGDKAPRALRRRRADAR